jgi:hypothetical protein
MIAGPCGDELSSTMVCNQLAARAKIGFEAALFWILRARAI